MEALQLTPDQNKAYEDVVGFLSDPDAQVLVLSGYAGTGKSTLVNHILSTFGQVIKMASLINQGSAWELVLTATTNKAAQALADITNREVQTIQSALGLRVDKNFQNGQTKLVATGNKPQLRNSVLVVDEASYVDHNLLKLIFEETLNCKIIFIGDPAQLAPVNSSKTPVFTAGFTEAKLTEVVRQQQGNPIIELATLFRSTVNTGQWFKFAPDGKAIRHMPRDAFDDAIVAEFTRPDWMYKDSKVLAWTNKKVIEYNHAIRSQVQGESQLQLGDYAICNKYLQVKRNAIKTDQIVQITALNEAQQFDVEGWWVQMDYTITAFLPKDRDATKAAISKAKADGNYDMVREIDTSWVDLRAAYACTINKSQGSTYKRVFIDLDDVGKCRNANTLARMMYVAVTRASDQVIMTGDLV